MSLAPENKIRADRGLRAVFVDSEAPPSPGGRRFVAREIAERVRDMMHLCDRYGLDFSTLVSVATALYLEDQAEAAGAEAVVKVEDGRNTRNWSLRRRRVAPPPATRDSTAGGSLASNGHAQIDVDLFRAEQAVCEEDDLEDNF